MLDIQGSVQHFKCVGKDYEATSMYRFLFDNPGGQNRPWLHKPAFLAICISRLKDTPYPKSQTVEALLSQCLRFKRPFPFALVKAIQGVFIEFLERKPVDPPPDWVPDLEEIAACKKAIFDRFEMELAEHERAFKQYQDRKVVGPTFLATSTLTAKNSEVTLPMLADYPSQLIILSDAVAKLGSGSSFWTELIRLHAEKLSSRSCPPNLHLEYFVQSRADASQVWIEITSRYAEFRSLLTPQSRPPAIPIDLEHFDRHLSIFVLPNDLSVLGWNSTAYFADRNSAHLFVEHVGLMDDYPEYLAHWSKSVKKVAEQLRSSAEKFVLNIVKR